jgi:predicted nuclease of predicted toxin-antitoxin system
MLSLLADECLDGQVLRGLRGMRPQIDIVRVQDVGLRTQPDELILEWAAANGRILVTTDRGTISQPAFARVTESLPMPGVFILRRGASVHDAIHELVLVDECSEQTEWTDRVVYLPL